jgi:hypothetical protein
MDARIKIGRETRQKLDNPVLDEAAKRKLRMQRVIEFIDKTPPGKPIKNTDVILSAGYDVSDNNDYANGYYLIKQMIEQGMIARQSEPRKQTAYYKVIKSTLEATSRIRTYSLSNLEKEAKEFLWNTGSDSLREFVNYKVGQDG